MRINCIEFKASKHLGFMTVIFILSSWLCSAFAVNLPYYNLDSLVWMARDIVEGTVTQASAVTVHVSLTAVHSGNLHAGTTITVAATDFFRVVDTANPMDLNGRRFQNGDRLILFLVDARESFAFNPPVGAKMPVPSGLKLILDDRVYGFKQSKNPGPYQLENTSGTADGKFPTLEQFRESIGASSIRIAAIRQELSRAPSAEQIPYLLTLIKVRLKGLSTWIKDAIVDDATVRIASLRDCDAIYEALMLRRDYEKWQPTLFYGLTTPAGREFILRKVADIVTPLDMRILLAEGLADMGISYRATVDPANENTTMLPIPTAADNQGYLQRIAELAAFSHGNTGLSVALLKSMRSMAQSDCPVEVKADLEAAIRVLIEFYKKDADEEQKYRIELCLAIDPQAFKRLDAKGGPVIGILKEAAPSSSGGALPNLLAIDYAFTPTRNESPEKFSGVVVFEPVDGGQAYEMQEFPGIGMNAGGMRHLSLPSGIRKVRYYIYCRFEIDRKIVGKSHGFYKQF